MHTPEETQFYEDLRWMRTLLRSKCSNQTLILQEVEKRYDRMCIAFHEQGLQHVIDGD